MIDTSTELFNAFLEDTRQIKVRVTIGNRVFDNDNIATLSLEYGSMDGGSLDIGGAFANSLKIGFSELVEGLKELDEIEIELGAVLPDETIEYVKMGTFIINEEVMMDRNNNTTSIDAMDRMVMLGEIYEPTLEGDYARIIDIAVDIANQAGVVVSSDFDRLRTDSIQIPREKTLREAIGLIAQFEVGFATFNRDGELAIRKLNDPNFNITPEDYTMKGLVKNEVPFRLNGIQCQIGDGEDDVLQAGASTGNQIALSNGSMTQAHLDRIYTELSTLNYYPFSLDWYGHPALEAGDWIEIEDLQGNKFKAPNLHYTLEFNGGLKAKSQAETTSSSEVVYQYKSPLQQEIQAIAARLSASSGNRVYDDLTEPENPKEGDLWFKPEGPDTLILKYTRLEDGTLDWVEELNTGDTTKNADAIAEQQQEIEDARQVADEARDSINTAITNAGFTSLDDTIQNMNYITMNAEQSAQQAITNASNAYGLAQTSVSEAQTAQANSLTALGKADNALDGVSSLNVRVDEVEAELELKADNTYMTEDGELITLSNAITFNAHRFSSDMSRIESRVESLAGEINLVILKDAFENSRLNPGTTYPNPASSGPDYQTMRELIAVQGGEELAMSKETSPSGFNQFRFNFYDDTGAYLTGETSTLNQYIVTVPQNATKMWVSYPTGSKPQIVRGTTFVPYRPNLADQMTTDEMVLFRNEYDEYADRTERRLSAIDTTGGSLDILNNRITSTAEQVTTDMTALINTKVGSDEFTEFYQNEYLETAGEVSRKISLTDIKSGERNLLKDSGTEKRAEASDIQVGRWEIAENIEHGEEVTLVWEGYSNGKSNMNFNWVGQHSLEKAVTSGGANEGTTIHSVTFNWKNADDNVTHLTLNKSPYASNYNMGVKWVKLVKGNITSLDWRPAYEDTQEQISHIESSWTQRFDSFEQTITGEGGINTQLQTLDSTMSSIVDPVTGRLSIVEQIAGGLQATVADKANQSQVTQLSNVWNASVGKLTDFIYNSTFEDGSLLGWEGITVETGYTHSPSKYYGAIRQRDAYFGDLIPIEGGERLNFSIHAWNFTNNPQPFKFGVRYYDRDKNPISWYAAIQSSRGNILEKHTASWVTSASARYVRTWVQIDAYSNFTPWFFSQPQISRVPTNAQMSMLENNINLRVVSKGDVLSQINIEADRQLFQSGKILFDANNVIFTGTAWIPNSVIGDLSADKITSGELNTAVANSVFVNASSVSANTTDFIKSAWNSINSRADMDANRLRFTHADGSSTQIGVNGLERVESGATRPYQYRTYVGSSNVSGEFLDSGITINLPSDFKGKQFQVVVSLRGWSGGSTNGIRYNPTLIRAGVDSVNRSNGSFVVKGSASGFNSKHEFHWVMDSATGTNRKLVQVANLSVGDVSGPFGRGVDVYLAYTAIY